MLRIHGIQKYEYTPQGIIPGGYYINLELFKAAPFQSL